MVVVVQASDQNCRRVSPTVSWHCAPLLPTPPRMLIALVRRRLPLAGRSTVYDFVVNLGM